MAHSHTVFNTTWPADSLEFCPQSGFEDIFVCGTYNLETCSKPLESNDESEHVVAQPQKRTGKCLVFNILDNEGAEHPSFQLIQELSLPAVPDMKWCYRSPGSSPILALADSEGNISLGEWQDHQLRIIQSIPCASADVLCLSLDWSNRRFPSTGLGSLVASLSNGTLCLLRPSQTSLEIVETWHAHDFEPWIAAWDYWDMNVMYSGGDDLKLKRWDTRQGFSRPIAENKRFAAGVTSIQSHPNNEHILAVGSYGSTVRLFDSRKLSETLTEVGVNGGAWRVKWHPSHEHRTDLLVACMHDGCKIVQFQDSFDRGDVVKRFDKHKSMVYGADWSHVGNGVVGSCSFYDCSMFVWRV